MNKPKNKHKTKHVSKVNIAKLADVLDIEFKKILPLIPLPDGSVVYRNFVVKQDLHGNWCIFSKGTATIHGQFNLKTCALVGAKCLSQMQLQRYNEIKDLDNRYWSSTYRTSVYEHNIKSAKDFDRYLILLNKLEDSTWKARHYKEEISKLFRWSFV